MKSKSSYTKKLIILILFFQFINFIYSDIDKIIRLGGDTFRYITFATNMLGDMIVITSSSSSDSDIFKKRILFGLKNNGRYYFTDENNKETPFISLTASTSRAKMQSESVFLYLSNGDENDGNQYLFSYAIGGSTVEIYDLKKPYSISDTFSNLYYSRTPTSIISSLFKLSYRPDSKYYYYLAHIAVANSIIQLYTFRDSFDSVVITSFHGSKGTAKKIGNSYIVTCFETENFIVICFYQNFSNKLEIYGYKETTGSDLFTEQFINDQFETDNLIFFKGIHLKEEIGVFMYYTPTSSTTPIISIREYISNSGMTEYKSYGKIDINRIADFNSNPLLNDILKMSNDKICIASASLNREKLYLIILHLLDNDEKMIISYHEFNMLLLEHKIYLDIKLYLYNSYICLGFSHCVTEDCESSDVHFSSLMILINWILI